MADLSIASAVCLTWICSCLLTVRAIPSNNIMLRTSTRFTLYSLVLLYFSSLVNDAPSIPSMVFILMATWLQLRMEIFYRNQWLGRRLGVLTSLFVYAGLIWFSTFKPSYLEPFLGFVAYARHMTRTKRFLINQNELTQLATQRLQSLDAKILNLQRNYAHDKTKRAG